MTKKLRFSLILIYCLAISCLFVPFIKQVLIIYRTQNVSIKTSETIRSAEDVPLEAVQPPDLSDVLKFEQRQTFDSTGQIVIPGIEISLPLFSGVVNDQLLVGAGTLFPERNPEKQNMVVIGHHLGQNNLLFGKLLDVAVGDAIYLEYQSQFYQYRVSQTQTIQQTELHVLENRSKAEITLITCDKPTHTEQRFVVKGRLVTPAKGIKHRVAQQRRLIETKNQQRNLTYCIVVMLLFLVSLVIGIRIITKISK
ncbi:class A sortase [Enterococcus sp. AZ196]|uniref:class A sortase n=1 Tax=Enterococcus sp. AZ196 TaxID=2774659 RepID=UPI003D2D9F87